MPVAGKLSTSYPEAKGNLVDFLTNPTSSMAGSATIFCHVEHVVFCCIRPSLSRSVFVEFRNLCPLNHFLFDHLEYCMDQKDVPLNSYCLLVV